MVEVFGKQTSTALSSSRNAPQWQSVRIRVLIAPSCALLHNPADLDEEKHLDGELRDWLAFSKQKLEEIAVLERGLVTGRAAIQETLETNRMALDKKKESPRIHDVTVKGTRKNSIALKCVMVTLLSCVVRKWTNGVQSTSHRFRRTIDEEVILDPAME